MLKKTFLTLTGLLFLACLGLALRHFSVSTTDSNSLNISTQPLFSASLPDTQGIKQNLSQYQGKIIVLNFWASWCPPCREEMPELSQLHQEFLDKNVVVLGVAVDELALVKDFLQTSPVSYPVFITENARMDLSNLLGNEQDVLPYTVIIDTNGSVIKTFYGRISKPLIETALQPLLLQ